MKSVIVWAVAVFCVSLLPASSFGALSALWRFDANAAVQPDSSGNGNGATPNGNATWVFDGTRASGTMAFDGNNDFLAAADSASLSIVGDMTVAAWINVGNTVGNFNNWRGVVSKGIVGNAQPAPYQMWFNQNDLNPHFGRGNGSTSQFSIIGASNAPRAKHLGTLGRKHERHQCQLVS
jgi:hypothetical protein